MKNTILVYEDSVSGQVDHLFCTEEVAKERLGACNAPLSGGSMFTSDGVDAAAMYVVSPNLRERVEEAKRKLRADITVRDALNRHEVPEDVELRTKIIAAIKELRLSVLLPACT